MRLIALIFLLVASMASASTRDADVVNLGFVLNVIEDPIERAETLRRAFALARQVLIIAVRVDRSLEEGVELSDGLVTERGTFQKIYTQAEFTAYVESVLSRRLHVAALGVGYVFDVLQGVPYVGFVAGAAT